MDSTQLDAIKQRNAERRKLRAVATRGTWRTNCGSYRDREFDYYVESNSVALWDDKGSCSLADAEFIAAAGNDTAADDIDALLAELERLRSLNNALSVSANKFIGYVATCQLANTDYWMRHLGKWINHALVILDDPDRVEFDGQQFIKQELAARPER